MRKVLLASLFSFVVAFAPPAPAQDAPDDEAAKAREEAVAARARLAKAAEEARIADEKAARAERRALERDLAAKEDELDRLRDAGDAEGAARAEREAKDLALRLSASAARSVRPQPAVRPAPGAPVAPAPRSPFLPDEGLPPLRARAGSKADAAVDAALDWLARHQSSGGSWDADGFASRCQESKCPGSGGPLYDAGMTGLATLAFLGIGETHKTPKHGTVVREATRHLKGIQDAEGCFGVRTSSHFVYNHAFATLAMCEAYGLTQSPLFKASAQQGANFVQHCRNPYLAWRYGVRPGDNDTSVTGWMVLALASARRAGLDVEDAAFQGAMAWIDKVTDPETGRAGYTARGNGPARPIEFVDAFPPDRVETMTAQALVVRMLCGSVLYDAQVRKGVDLCLNRLPAWEGPRGGTDFLYWFWGTHALGGVEGDVAARWNEALGEALLPYQRGEGDGCARGSWDPVDPWGMEGGRVYSTAINALSLEASGRFPRALRGK
jgi:hypothetical protein